MKSLKVLIFIVLISVSTTGAAQSANVLKFDDAMWIGFDAEGITFYYHEWSKVETYSKTGNVKYSSHGQVDESAILPDKPMKFYTGHMGFTCAHDAPYFQYVLTPSGKASIKCQSWPFSTD